MKLFKLMVALFMAGVILFSSTISQPSGWTDSGTIIAALSNRNVVVGATCPGGVPVGSVCLVGNLYANGVTTTSLGPYAAGGKSGSLATGTAAARPACSTVGYYLASDTHVLSSCDGTNWSGTLNPSGNWAQIHNSTAGGVQTYDSAGVLVSGTVATGAKALATASIASTACTAAQTDTATGAATTDVIVFTPNADITAVTGYAPVTTGGLAIYAYATADTVNFKVCNPTASPITPGDVTLNWRVVR